MTRIITLAAVAVFSLNLSPALAADAAAGKAKAAVCAGCHGVDGNSSNPMWPHLAGQHAAEERDPQERDDAGRHDGGAQGGRGLAVREGLDRRERVVDRVVVAAVGVDDDRAIRARHGAAHRAPGDGGPQRRIRDERSQ